MRFFRFPSLNLMAALALAASVAFVPAIAEARLGGGSSFGSRGTQTYSAPPATSSAPRGAAPMERSMTPNQPSYGQATPGYAPSRGGLFGGGLFSGLSGGLLGGLLGAGLFGMMFGHGMFGGMGGIGSLFGLLIQIGLLYLVVRFVMNWFASRKTGYADGPTQSSYQSGPASGFGSGFGGFGGASNAPVRHPLDVRPEDFGTFEQLLGDIQTAYGEENLDRVRSRVTPEMASYFSEQVADNARKGLVNQVSNVRFLAGDLSEAWSEAVDEYATVSIRYSLIDVTKNRASGQIVEGNPNVPVEVTEFWTFQRPVGSTPAQWRLSAIQQVG